MIDGRIARSQSHKAAWQIRSSFSSFCGKVVGRCRQAGFDGQPSNADVHSLHSAGSAVQLNHHPDFAFLSFVVADLRRMSRIVDQIP